jgi:hypothetical protein
MSKKLIALALLVSVAFAVSTTVGAERIAVESDGAVSWVVAPTEATGHYWGYDDDDDAPFAYPPVTPLAAPAVATGGTKQEPYYNRCHQYSMPDSFWYYGHWYKPGDILYISPDGWISFDESGQEGVPTPPTTTPPIPNTDDPNELMAALWMDFDPTRTSDPSDVNRVYHQYRPMDNELAVQWYDVESYATGNAYNFMATLELGGQERLIDRGECGVIFSYHFIHFYYINDNGNGWDSELPATGIEDISGDHGINYPVANLTNGRLIRFGYYHIFNHDVEAIAFMAPGSLTLRYTSTEPRGYIGNVGREAETFTVTLDIYDESDETRVYHEIVAGYHLISGETDVVEFPCWETVGEIGTIYRKELIVALDGDQCADNDVFIENTLVHCDDTLNYTWNFADVGPLWWSPGYLYSTSYSFWYTFGCSYRLDGGALIKGARLFMTYTDVLKTSYGLTDNPAVEIWGSQNGCGQVASGSDPIGRAPSPTYQDGWNYVEFPGNVGPRKGQDADGNFFEEEVGLYVVANESEGNIWGAATSAATGQAHGTGCYPGIAMLLPAEPTSCYPGAGDWARGAVWRTDYSHEDAYSFVVESDVYTPVVELTVHLGFTPENPAPAPDCYYDEPHDLSIYRFEEPGIDWVPEDVPITAELALGNFGRQTEPDGSFFPVKMFVVDHTVNVGDTVFAETVNIPSIGWFGDPLDGQDTMLVPMTPWTPEGICNDTMPFVDYEMIGLVRLGEVGPDQSDHCPYNDTLRRFVTCLLQNDVGVIAFVDADEKEWGQNYEAGTEFDIIATVENFGYNEEHDVPVDMEIMDIGADPDTLVWHNIQEVTFIDWRGNNLGNPYTVEVNYPTWTTPGTNHYVLECRTELVGDDCPEDDETIHAINSGIEEGPVNAVFALQAITPNPFVGSTTVSFSVANTTNVSLKVYDISGKLVTTLVDGTRNAGSHNIEWNGTDNAGRNVAQGIYLVRMDAESFSATKKVVLY